MLFGNGDGTFAPQVVVDVGAVSAVVTGDLDGDGIADLAVATNGGIRIVHNNGDRTFMPVDSYPCGCGRLALADVNGDGLLDVIGASLTQLQFTITGGDSVSVLLHRH